MGEAILHEYENKYNYKPLLYDQECCKAGLAVEKILYDSSLSLPEPAQASATGHPFPSKQKTKFL